MEIVTGDRYLEELVRFVDRHAEQLLDGTLTLKLNPVGLHYVQSRLEALQDLERLRSGAPVDYLRAYVSDLGDHRALEQLRRILGLLNSLKVVSVLPSTARDPTPLSILPFGHLKVLELRGCDLSTSAARGLLELRHNLETLICYNSTDALKHVFASRIADIRSSAVWNRLTFVSCVFNGLVLMDESLQLLPAVETLDLSRNRFAKVDNLRKCTKLRHLDLGFNHLRTIALLNQVSCPIVKLVLRNNALTSLRGIENLNFIEGLDLSYNIISSFSEVEILACLPSLRSLWLEGNPISCSRLYKAQVFSYFTHPERLKLDEKNITPRDYWERHFIIVSRQKQPPGAGFYFPARYDAEYGSVNKEQNFVRKKQLRLASIDNKELWHCSDSAEQETLSYDSATARKDKVNNGEMEAVDLMARAEYLKKERSDLWLREFKELLDFSTNNNVEYNFKGNDTNHNSKEPIKDSTGKKPYGQTSGCGKEFLQPLEDRNCLKNFDVDNSYGEEYTDNRKSIPHISLDNGGSLPGNISRSNDTGPMYGVFKDEAEHLNSKDTHIRHFSVLDEVNQIKFVTQTSHSTVIDDVVDSCSSSVYHGSPPQYKEDILHRRLNLEEEFMQLSCGSLYAVSTDSDTSCSDDDSCRYSMSDSENRYSILKSDVEDSDHTSSLYENNVSNGGHEQTCFVDNRAHVPECDLSDTANSDGDNEVIIDNVRSIDQQNCVKKRRRRLVSLETSQVIQSIILKKN